MPCRRIEGKNFSAFICGEKPSDHTCDENAKILILNDGNRVDLTEENQKKYADQIVAGSVCCSVCGRAAIDNINF